MKTRNECEFNRTPDPKFPLRPCWKCGLDIRKKLRRDCPYLAKVNEVERVRAEGKREAQMILDRLDAYSDGIGDALKDNREYRSTGEPAMSDRQEILELIRVNKILETKLKESREDVVEAAGELMVPVPRPGTDTARLLIANRLLKAEVERLRREVEKLEVKDHAIKRFLAFVDKEGRRRRVTSTRRSSTNSRRTGR